MLLPKRRLLPSPKWSTSIAQPTPSARLSTPMDHPAAMEVTESNRLYTVRMRSRFGVLDTAWRMYVES